jgi:hypothetical protein
LNLILVAKPEGLVSASAPSSPREREIVKLAGISLIALPRTVEVPTLTIMTEGVIGASLDVDTTPRLFITRMTRSIRMNWRYVWQRWQWLLMQ